MLYLVDTNIALRISRFADPEYTLVEKATRSLARRGDFACYTQQTRREFWNVCTRPATANGWGMSTVETVEVLRILDHSFRYLPDRPAAGPEWDRLVRQYDVIGRAVHDAQLVASMLVNGITHILTLNDADFQRYRGEITVVHPRDV